MPEKSKAIFAVATIYDFQRNLDLTVIHAAQQKATSERSRITNEYAARGLGQSGPLIGAVAAAFDALHKEAIEGAMNLIGEFVKTDTPISLEAMASETRTRFSNLATTLLLSVPTAGLAQPQADLVRKRYAAIFQQRLDAALSDIAIGFINGRKIMENTKEESVKFTDAMILRPTFMGMGVDLTKVWLWTRRLRFNAREAIKTYWPFK